MNPIRLVPGLEGSISGQMGRSSEWLIPAALVVLCAVPVLAGTVRLAEVAHGEANAANARFLSAPLPFILHAASVTAFGMLGAFQFAPALRRRWPRWHRRAGRIVVPAGLIAALSGLWMTVLYDAAPNDGPALYLMRIAVGLWMLAALATGYRAIRRRDVGAHSDWMLRGYAIGMGAGTQVLTGLPWFILAGQPDTGTRAVLLGLGWTINAALAEWIIARRKVRAAPPGRRTPPAGVFPSG